MLGGGADAADGGGRVDHDVRAGFGQGALARLGRAQVVLCATRDEDLRRSGVVELRHDAATAEPGPAGDHESALLEPAAHTRRPVCGYAATLRARMWRAGSSPASRRSPSTISCTSSAKLVRASQPSSARALPASPQSRSTSAGRR